MQGLARQLTPLLTMTPNRNIPRKVGGIMTALTRKRIRSFSMGMSMRTLWRMKYNPKQSRLPLSISALAGRWLGKVLKLGHMASMQLRKKSPACTVRIAVHIKATKARIHIAGNAPYMPNIDLTATGKGMAYLAPIQVNVESMKNCLCGPTDSTICGND